MHKLVKIAATAFAITLFFGPAFTAHGQGVVDSMAGSALSNFTGGVVPPSIALPLAKAAGSSLAGTVKDKITDAATDAGGNLLSFIGLKGLGYALTLFGYVAGLIGATLFTLAGLLVEFGLFLNTTILDSEVVQLGWRFCRDLANLGFTIGIVVIAYATMLGYESYGMKNLIKNFVFAAILVNFSFSIAGFLIDGSNLMTNFFVNAAIGGGPSQAVTVENIHKFSLALADAFGPQRLLRTADATKGLDAFEAMKGNGGLLASVLSVFFVALFTMFAALGMLAVGLTTFWRFANLSGLMIVMPLAILCYAFPKTQKHYSEWWKKFSCQLTYMPVATFSLYIVIMFVRIKAQVGLAAGQISADKLMSSFEKAQNGASAGSAITALSSMAYPFQTITDMVIVLTMVFLAITKSRSVGCSAGKVAIEWAEGLKKWAVGSLQGAPKATAGWAGRKYLSGGTEGAGPEQNRGTRLGNFLQRIPLVSRLVPRLNNFAAGTKKNLGNFETEYKGLGDVQLRNALYNPDIKIDAERMAAAAKEAVARGLLGSKDPEKNVTQEKFAEFIPALKRYGFDKDVLKKLPHLYGKFGLDPAKEEDKKKLDGFLKDFKPEDVENLTEEAFADPEIVSRLTGAHLEKLPKDEKRRNAFAATFNGLSQSMDAEKFNQFVAKTFAKPEADAALLPALLRNPLVVKNLTNANLKKLAGGDKKEHRDALLETIGDASKLSDKEFAEFMRTNFANSKSIDEIHPEIIRNKRFFSGLDEKHIQQMNKEPEEKQQEAMLDALRASYGAGGDKEKLDRMAKIIVEKKKDWQWSPLAESPETREAFNAVEAEYRSRHPEEQQQKKTAEETEKKQTKEKEKGWWEDDDKNPPAGGPQKPAPTPPKSPQGDTYGFKENPAEGNPEPANRGKGPDIGKMVDTALGSLQNDEAGKQDRASAAKPVTATTEKPSPATDGMTAENDQAAKTPLPKEFTEEHLESLERATSEAAAKTAPQPKPAPITPPELNALARTEENRIRAEQTTVTTYQEPLTPPSLPKPLRAEDNQLSVIPKAPEPDNAKIAAAAWSVNAKRKTLYEDLPKEGETPTVLKSAWEQLRNAERAYEKSTGQKLIGGRIPYERTAQYELDENKALEVSGETPERAPTTWQEFAEKYGERGGKLKQPPEPPQDRTERTNTL